MTLHSLHWQQALQGSNSWHNYAKDYKTWKLHGRWEWEWVIQSIFHDLGDPGLFFIFKQLARVGILVFSILGRRWNCDETPRKTRSSQSPSLSFTAQAERSWAEIQKCSWCCWNRDGKRCRWKQLLVLRLRSLTAKGKGQNKVKEPRKRGPRFFCCYLPLHQCPERSSWALLPAHSDRKAARREISHQLLRKPQELGEKNRPWGRQRCQQSQHKLKMSGNFSFPLCWFLCLWRAALPQALFPFVEGSFMKTSSPRWFWNGGVDLPCLWNSHCTLGTAAAPWETHWDSLGEISLLFPPQELNSNLPQPTTELGSRDHILMSH